MREILKMNQILKTMALICDHFDSYFHILFIALDFTINIQNVNTSCHSERGKCHRKRVHIRDTDMMRSGVKIHTLRYFDQG